MPEVDSYGPQRVAPEGIGGARVDTRMPLEVAGGGEARAQGTEAGAQVGSDLSHMAGVHEYMANEVIHQDAENQAMKALNDTVYGAQDPQGNISRKGLRQYTGASVTQIGPDGADLKGNLAKQLDQIQSGLPNDRVKTAFERTKRELLDRFDNEARPWAVKQLDSHDKAVTQDAVNTYTMDGVLNASKAFAPGTLRVTGPDGKEVGPPLNPVDYAKAKLQYTIISSAARRGLGPGDPEVHDHLVTAMGQFNQSVVSEMLRNRRPDMAQAYLKEHAKEMVPAHYEALGQRIDEIGTQVNAENVARRVLSQTGNSKDGLGMLEEMNLPEKVKQKAAPMVREGISAREQMEDLNQQRMIQAAEQKRGGAVEPLEKYLDPAMEFSKKNMEAIKFLNAPVNPPKSDRGALRDFTKVQTGSGWFGNHQNGLKTMDYSTLLTKYVAKVSPNTARYMMAAWKESQQGQEGGPAFKQFSQHADNLENLHQAVPNSAVNTEDAYYNHPAVAAAGREKRQLTSDESKQAVKDTALKAFQAGKAPAPAASGKDVSDWMGIPMEHRKAMETLPGLAGKVLSDEQKAMLLKSYNATKAGNGQAAKDFYKQAVAWQGDAPTHGASRTWGD